MHTVYICTVIYVPTGSFSHALNAALHDVKVNSTDASVAKRLRCTTGRQHRQRSSWMQLHIQVLKCSDYVRFFENDSLIPWYPRWLSSSSQGSIRIEPLPIASAEAVSRNHKVLSPECNSSISQVFLTLSSGVFRSHTFLNNKGQEKRQKNKKGGLPLSRCWKQNKRPSQNCSSELGQKPRKMPSFEKQLFRHSLHLKKRENHGKSAKATRTDAFWYIQPHMTVGRTKLSYIFAFGATRPKAACPNIKKQFMFQCFAQEKTMGKSFSFFISPPVQQGDPDFWHAITVEPTVITSHSVESCIMRWRLSVLRVELDGFVALR